MKKMDAHQVEEMLKIAALEQIEKRDCAGITKYLEPHYALKELATWALDKFGITVTPEEMLLDPGRGLAKSSEEIVALVEGRARAAYAHRDLEYPAEQAISFAFGPDAASADNPYGAEFLRQWIMMKYRADLSLEHIRGQSLRKLRDELIGYQEQYLRDGTLEKEIDALIAANPAPPDLARAFNARFGTKLKAEDLEPQDAEASPASGNGELSEPPQSTRDMLLERGQMFFRKELTDLEQFVLIQIFDQSWKDHLYAMDMLKTGIGLQAFAERDPRVAYKKEGYRYFQEMMSGVRDKVTDLIFRARFAGAQPEARGSAYRETAAVHDTSHNYGVSENVRETAGVAAGGGEMQQAADAPQGEGAKVKTITREAPKVGRNDPCPCGSGKKYKKCCGAQAA
jgi:preprotein translocase subunit SecA